MKNQINPFKALENSGMDLLECMETDIVIKGKILTSCEVERNGKLLVSLEKENEKYLMYAYLGRYIEIEKSLGEVYSTAVYNTAPNYLNTLIQSKNNKVIQE